MRAIVSSVVLGTAFAVALPGLALSQPVPPAVTSDPQSTPPWAYTLLRPGMKPPADDGKPQQLAGSKVSYTWAEIRNLFSAKDWFPEEHSVMPDIVAQGRKPDVYACGMCHY